MIDMINMPIITSGNVYANCPDAPCRFAVMVMLVLVLAAEQKHLSCRFISAIFSTSADTGVRKDFLIGETGRYRIRSSPFPIARVLPPQIWKGFCEIIREQPFRTSGLDSVCLLRTNELKLLARYSPPVYRGRSRKSWLKLLAGLRTLLSIYHP